MEMLHRFRIGGKEFEVTRPQFEDRVVEATPERIKKYFVEIRGRRYPVKQAVALGLGELRGGFQSQQAIGVLRSLGFSPAEVPGA